MAGNNNHDLTVRTPKLHELLPGKKPAGLIALAAAEAQFISVTNGNQTFAGVKVHSLAGAALGQKCVRAGMLDNGFGQAAG